MRGTLFILLLLRGLSLQAVEPAPAGEETNPVAYGKTEPVGDGRADPVGDGRADPVGDGRTVLQRGGYPWYDPWNDRERLVLPEKPKPRTESADTSWLAPVFQMLMYLLLAIVIATIVYFLINYVYHPELPERKKTKITETTVDQIEALPTRLREVDDYLAEAQRFVERGELGEAMIYFYSFQLITLDRFGLIRLMKGKTNRSYVRELARKRPPLASDLAASVRLFEDVFFGKLPLDRDAFFEVWDRREAFLQQVEAPA